MKWILPALVSALVGYGCGTTCPQIRDTRCNGDIVEVCGANKKWQRAMDCSNIQPMANEDPKTWKCVSTQNGQHTCISEVTQ